MLVRPNNNNNEPVSILQTAYQKMIHVYLRHVTSASTLSRNPGFALVADYKTRAHHFKHNLPPYDIPSAPVAETEMS